MTQVTKNAEQAADQVVSFVERAVSSSFELSAKLLEAGREATMSAIAAGTALTDKFLNPQKSS